MNRSVGSLSAQVAWNRSNRVTRTTNTVGLGKARNGIELKGRVIPFFETQSHRGTEKVATRRQTVVLQSTVDSYRSRWKESVEGGPRAPPYDLESLRALF